MREFDEQLENNYMIWKECNSLYEDLSKKMNVTQQEALFFYSMLEGDGEITQKDIADKWRMSKQTISMMVKRFEKAGYVSLKNSSEDKRRKFLLLSSEGKTFAMAVVKNQKAAELFAFEKMGIEKVKLLNELQKQFNDGLKEWVNENEL